MWDVAYSPDGQTIACGGWDMQLHLLDVATGTERPPITGVTTIYLRELSFSPDGRQIATGGSGPTLLWNATTGQEVPTTVKLPEGLCPTFLPRESGLAGWNHQQGRVVLCDLPSGQIRDSWEAKTQLIEGLAVSADGRFLASIGNDGVARIWSTAGHKEVATLIGHEGPIYAVAFTPNGTQLVTGGAKDRNLCVWDLPPICRSAAE